MNGRRDRRRTKKSIDSFFSFDCPLMIADISSISSGSPHDGWSRLAERLMMDIPPTELNLVCLLYLDQNEGFAKRYRKKWEAFLLEKQKV